MNIRHFFDNIDEKTIDRITEKYPPLSSDDKERLYAMSKNKYNSEKKENKNDYSEVMGVERYRKPIWHKVVSAVAAAVVVLGGIGGGAALIRRNNDADILKNESSQLAEIEDIAQQLTDEFFDLKNIISSRGAAYDENDTLTYTIGVFDDNLEYPYRYSYDRVFYRVTDERFKCSQDIYAALKNITSSKYFPEERYEEAVIPWEFTMNYEITNYGIVNLKMFYKLGSDVSMFENGSKVDTEYLLNDEGWNVDTYPINFEDNVDWEASYSIWEADYVEYNGSLYVLTPDYFLNPVGVVYDYNEKIEITDVTNDSFTVIRYADISHNENIIKRAEFKFILENDQWCIDDFSEFVLDTEGVGSEETDYTAVARQLSDKFLEFEYLMEYGNISYDENNSISFTVIDSENLEWTEEHGNYVATYYKVTDPRFTCRQDVYNEFRCLFSTTHYNKTDHYKYIFWEGGLEWRFGVDLSKYENGGTIDFAVNNHPNSEYIYLESYCDYNGELYVRQSLCELPEYTSDVTIKKTGENRFTATRSYTEYYADEYITSEECFEFVLEAGKWKIDKVYFSDEESEDVTESEDEYDYTAIATELTDKFLEFENIICCGDVSYDENQSIEFYLYDSNSPESTDNMSEISFNKVIDEKFTCRQDIYDELRKIFSDSYYPDDNMKNAMWVDSSYLLAYLGDDFSMYENGGKIDIAENFDNDDEFIFVYGTFCDYNGELYVRFDDERPDISEIISKYTTDIVITDIGDNHFTAKRCISRHGWDKAYGTELIFDFILENGEWVIENYREGMDVERSAAMVLEQYLRDSYSYDNVMLNADDMRIQDDFYYELDLQFCRIHVILLDYNGIETLDVEASISLAENKVLSAKITELN